MDSGAGKVREVFKKFFSYCVGDFMSFPNRKRRSNGSIDLCMEPMSYPADSKVRDFTDPIYTFSNVFYFIDDFWLNAVKKASKHELARIKDYFENANCD